MAMETTLSYIEPHTPEDWERWRPVFTQLYYDEDKKLPEVMEIMKNVYGVKASNKQYKTRIKAWKLRKYMKEEEAEKIVSGEALPSDVVPLGAFAAGDAEEAKKRAEKSLKRKRARTRVELIPPYADLDTVEEVVPHYTDTLVAWTPSFQTYESFDVPPSIQFSGVAEQFLLNLRAWTHDAFTNGHLDTTVSKKHHPGRQVARRLSSDLMAGVNLFSKGNEEMAWTYFKRAFQHLNSSELYNTWYHETPIRLLFEVSRVAHNGHAGLASQLLTYIMEYANTYLQAKDPQQESDSRRTLFGLFASLDVSQLRELYSRAAHVLFKGMESRLDKDTPLLYDVRLNRALDMLYYDPNADVSDWLPPIEDVDRACGPHSAHAIYFLLLDAYRLVAQDQHKQADIVCTQVRDRLALMAPGTIDSWRLGLAYRRLGRQQYVKQQYTDARRSFNAALRHVGDADKKTSTSILIEIYQCQESMAKNLGDPEDAELWRITLLQLEEKTKRDSDDALLKEVSLVPLNTNGAITKGVIAEEVVQSPMLTQSMSSISSFFPLQESLVINTNTSNKRRRLSPSPTRSPNRSMTC